MKKLLLISGLLVLVSALTLRAYFAFVPPPEATHTGRLAEIVPDRLQGWAVRDLDMAESPESSARISEFLNFDDALFRVFERGDTFVGLYIAYWSPGKASYRWAGAHTPDTCWV
ncbi:MAG: exosortase-associated EpsI family protein, partial [Opitutales bacterium]